MKLTKPQKLLLGKCADYTFPDNSGTGFEPLDGTQEAVIERLFRMGLVNIPEMYTPFSGAKITEYGRCALSKAH